MTASRGKAIKVLHGSFVISLVKRIAILGLEFSGQDVLDFFARPGVQLVRPEEADGLVALNLAPDSAPTLLAFKAQGKPIALLDAKAIAIAAQCFKDEGVTLAAITPETNGVYWEACADDDYVSDRENWLISTLGLTLTAREKAWSEFIQLV